MISKKNSLIAVLLGTGLFLSLTPVTAMAMDEPASVTITEPTVYQDLIQPNDFLVVVPYNIPFTDLPDDPINKTFLFKFIDIDGTTELGSILAFPYNDYGYGKGIVSFYFAASVNLTWESSYFVRIEQNPAFYPTPLKWSFALAVGDYTQTDGQTFNRASLKDEVLSIATDLEPDYGIELSSAEDTGTFLSAYGESYFRNAILGLQNMCPELFILQIREADYSTKTWATTFADNLLAQYTDTWVEGAMTGLGGLYSMDTSVAWGFVSVIVLVIVMIVSTKYSVREGTGRQVMPAFLDAFAVLSFSTLIGQFSLVWHGLIAFMCVFVGGMVLFLNRS